MKKLLCIPMLVLSLVACDKSPGSFGISVDKTSTTANDNSTTVGKEKKIDIANKTALNIKVLGPVVLATTVNQYLDEVGIKPPYRKRLFAESDKTLEGKVSSKLENRTITATILALGAMFEPAIGWPANDRENFARKAMIVSKFANDVAFEAMKKVDQTAIKNPSDARQAVITAIAGIPVETLEALWASKVAEVKAERNVSINTGGSNVPIEFRIGRDAVTIGPQGMHYISAGTTLFGEGKIGGQAIEVSMESSLSTGLGRKLSLDNKTNTGESESVKIDAGLKN